MIVLTLIIYCTLNMNKTGDRLPILCFTSRNLWCQRVFQSKILVISRTICVCSHVWKGTLGLMHKGCVLQRVSLGALSDITVVLGMRQSIKPSQSIHLTSTIRLTWPPLWRIPWCWRPDSPLGGVLRARVWTFRQSDCPGFRHKFLDLVEYRIGISDSFIIAIAFKVSMSATLW